MIKFYKVIRRGSEEIYLPEQILEKIIESEKQIVKIMQENNTWRLINKSDILDAYFDKDYSEAKEKEKTITKMDKYLDKERNVIVYLERGTLPEGGKRYEKLE